MKELNKNEIYSLEGLSDEQLGYVFEYCDFSDYENFKKSDYIRYDYNWCYGLFKNNSYNITEKNITAKAIDLFEEEEKPSQYKLGIDTFKRCESNMAKDEILACCKFNIDKYNWRKKGQDKEDFEKIINYAKWALEQLK